jgi:hypothetical protein
MESGGDIYASERGDLFWNLVEEIVEGVFFGGRFVIRLKAHVSEERYSKSDGEELVAVAPRGTRIYVMGRPYILEPEYRLTVGVYPEHREQGAIGEVTSSDRVGMRPRQVGQGQAWLYPAGRTLILCECYLHDFCRADDPRTDENLHGLWGGFESFLLRQLPHPIECIVTPSWKPIYAEKHEQWQEFLVQQGYSPIGKRAFGKEITSEFLL